MATERLDIVVTEKGAKSAASGIDNIGKTAKDTSGALGLLQKALTGLGIAALTHQAIQLADAYTNIQNRLRNVTSSTQQLTAVTESLFGIANKTRQSFESTAELYSRVGLAAKDLGVSQTELLSFTESLNQAVALSGASATEASAAMIQLSQGLAAGALRGEELNSVLEQTPVVADVIAKQLKVTRGELRQMGQDGKITAEIVLDAFASAREELAERFGKTVPTIGQAFTVLRNNVIGLWGEFTTGSGISEALSKAILFLADNLETAAKALLAVGAAVAVAFAPALFTAAVGAATKAVLLFNAAVLANPIGALTVALAAATAALYLFQDEIVLTEETGRTLGDVFDAAGVSIAKSYGEGITLASEFNDLLGTSTDLSETFSERFARGLDNVIKLFDVVNAALKGFEFALNEIGDIIVDVFQAAWIKVKRGAVGAINEIINAINLLPDFIKEKFGIADLIEPIVVEQVPVLGNLGSRVAEAFGAGFDEGIANSLTIQSRRMNEYQQEYEKFIAQLKEPTGNTKRTGSAPKTDDAAAKKLADRLKKEADELETLVRSVDKAYAAQGQLTDQQATLTREVEKGAISQERANQIMEISRRQLEDQLDPLAAINEELQLELEAIGQTAQEREIANRTRQIENDLLSSGVILKDADTDAIRRQITAIVAMTEAEAKRQEQLDFQKDLLEGIRAPQEQYAKTMDALNALLAQGAISFDEYNRAANDALITLLDTQTDVGSGVERALLKLERDYTDFASMAEKAVTNFASSAEEAFVQFAKTGKLSFNDLADSIIADITRMAFRAAASGLFGSDGLLGSLMGAGASLFGSFFGGGATVGAPTQLGMFSSGYGATPGLYHSGGTGGAPGAHRSVDPALFLGAPRLHSGSMGLKAGEVAAILREDERVYTPEQDAARSRGGGTTVIVNNNAPNTKASATESQDMLGNKSIEVTVDELTSAALNNPSSRTFKTMRERFGANITTVNR